LQRFLHNFLELENEEDDIFEMDSEIIRRPKPKYSKDVNDEINALNKSEDVMESSALTEIMLSTSLPIAIPR
jgi:hypothetical protein